MAAPELGQKQVCPNCQAKFYDLGRRPAHCPKCATDFDPEEALKLRNRRGRPAAGYPADDEAEDQVKEKAADADEDEEEEAVVTPEIDQEGHEPILTPDDDDAPVDPTEEPGMGEAVEDDDVLADDDDDDSVPFIEDEDDDGFEDEIKTPKEDE